MLIILGATGHVGPAVAQALLDQNLPVTAVVHDDRKAADWGQLGALTAVVDVLASAALRTIFQTGTRAFLLNPPAIITSDTDGDEHATASSIVAALDGSGLEKVVLESTFGAQPGESIGDPSVLSLSNRQRSPNASRSRSSGVPITSRTGTPRSTKLGRAPGQQCFPRI